MAAIFINYRKQETEWAALLLYKELAARYGEKEVFLDHRSIPAGRDFRPQLWAALGGSAALLVLIGREWLTIERGGQRRIDLPNDFVRTEIAQGLRADLRVIPVLVGDVSLPPRSELPEAIQDLASRQYVRFEARRAKYDIMRLVDELTEIIGAPDPPPESPKPDARPADPPTVEHNAGFINTNSSIGTQIGRDGYLGDSYLDRGRPR